MIGGRGRKGSIFVVGALVFTTQTVAFRKFAEVVAGEACSPRAAADVVAVLVENGFQVLGFERVDNLLLGVFERDLVCLLYTSPSPRD